MAKFNKYVEIGQPTPGLPGADAGMIKIAQKYNNVVAVHGRWRNDALDWFKKNAPERIIECGIAEANGAVVAGALAAEGFMPFLHSFTFAVVGRAYNQIRQSILVDRFNVKITGRDGVWGEVGVSHNLVEGIGCHARSTKSRNLKSSRCC